MKHLFSKLFCLIKQNGEEKSVLDFDCLVSTESR